MQRDNLELHRFRLARKCTYTKVDGSSSYFALWKRIEIVLLGV